MIFPREFEEVEGGCIEISNLRKGTRKNQYRMVTFEGGAWRAHRLSYKLNKEDIPRSCKSKKQGFVLHKCDNKSCINPDHLYLGTAKQNVEDMFQRNEWIRLNLSRSIGDYARSEEGRGKASKRRAGQLQKMTSEERKRMMDQARRKRGEGQPQKAIGAYNSKATKEERAAAARKGWEKRRAGEI